MAVIEICVEPPNMIPEKGSPHMLSHLLGKFQESLRRPWLATPGGTKDLGHKNGC